MSSVIRLQPGTPDDDNRDYLPESLKHSDIVVNENGNNSQPYPAGLTEHREVLVGGVEDTWFTFVPSNPRPGVAMPLVISLHGGLMTGWGQAVYSSWTAVAEREGFVVVFPDAHERRMWAIDVAPEHVVRMTTPNPEGLYLPAPAASVDANHDLQLVRALIERMAHEHDIDRERIFLHGMSAGNIMASQFARHLGDVLAGVAGSGGPTDPAMLFDADGEIINTAGPLAVWESRLDLDLAGTYYSDDIPSVVVANRDYWLRLNGVTEPPAIAVRGLDNFAFYRGAHADVVFRDVHNRDHGQTFDDAELVWDYLFSGVRRDPQGAIVREEPLLPRTGDGFALAVAAGRDSAWVSGRRVRMSTSAFVWDAVQYHGRGGATLSRGSYVYAPIDLLAEVFDAALTTEDDGRVAELTLGDGRTLQFARGAIGCVVDGRITAMLAEAVWRDGVLCLPVQWLAESILDLRASTHSGVLYVTDHHSRLSGNMARLLADLLGSSEH